MYGEWQTRHRFFHDNRALLEEAEELEHRARRRDIVVDEHTLFDFYDARVGADVVSGAHFDSLVEAGPAEAARPADLRPGDARQRGGPRGVASRTTRTTWQEGGLTLPLSYHFAPGAADDGVTVDLPLATLNQVDRRRAVLAGAGVPRGARGRAAALAAQAAAGQLRARARTTPGSSWPPCSPGEEPLLDALERHLRSRTGVARAPRGVGLVQGAGAPAADLPRRRPTRARSSRPARTSPTLKEPLAGPVRRGARPTRPPSTPAPGSGAGPSGRSTRSFEQLRAGHQVKGYPALVDEGAHASGCGSSAPSATRRRPTGWGYAGCSP